MIDITNSERSTAGCSALWLFRYGLGLDVDRAKTALHLGSIVHQGLDVLTEGGIDAAILAMREYADELRPAPGGMIDPSRPVGTTNEDVDAILLDAEDILRRYVSEHGERGGWEVVEMSEHTLRSPARVPHSGRRSNRTSIAGVVDKLVRVNGEVWIVDHKTTSIALDRWLSENRYSPQGPTYAWLVREVLGIEVRGIVYDLISTTVPHRELRVTNPTKDHPNGRIYAYSVDRLPATTADRFLAQVVALGQDLDSVDWYREVYQALQDRDRSGHWFRREFEPFDRQMVDRAGDELYHEGTRLRRMRERVAPWRRLIVSRSEGYSVRGPGRLAPQDVIGALHDIGAEFPRNPAMCRRYNRLCSFAGLCETWSADALHDIRVKPTLHMELDDTTSDE